MVLDDAAGHKRFDLNGPMHLHRRAVARPAAQSIYNCVTVASMPQLDSLNMQITGSKEMLAKPRLVMKIYVLGVVLLQALGSVTYAKPVTLLGERGGHIRLR